MATLLGDTLDRVSEIRVGDQSVRDDIKKTYTTATGIQGYDLASPANRLYPVLSPLRNLIPRVKPGMGDTVAHWKAIVGINTTNVPSGLSEGNRNAYMAVQTKDYTAPYVTIGEEGYVSHEEELAAMNFDDVRSLCALNALQSLMVKEEKMILGGNRDVPLGTTPTPTAVALAIAGSTLPAGNYNVGCVALTFHGWERASVATGVVAVIARVNADGSTDTIPGGAAQKSALAAVVVAAGDGVRASVTPVNGAIAYAWYIGTAGNEKLYSITTINSVQITAAPAVGAQNYALLPAADNSAEGIYSFNGILYNIFGTGSNSYIKVMATGTPGTGTPLTSAAGGRISEFDEAFMTIWDNYKLEPDTIWINARDKKNVQDKILAGGAAPLYRYNMDANQPNLNVAAGAVIAEYVSPLGTVLAVKVHPWTAPGTIVFTSMKVPYPMSNVSSVLQMRCQRDYYQLEWPARSRKYEYGVYSREVLQNMFPPAFGVITNVANG